MNKFHLKVACFFILFIVALVTSLYSTNIILKNEGLLLALGTLIICISLPRRLIASLIVLIRRLKVIHSLNRNKRFRLTSPISLLS